MLKFVSRKARWPLIALGGLVLLAGLIWGWMSWHCARDLRAQAASAYARRDFRQAAGLGATG